MDLKKLNKKIGDCRNIIIAAQVVIFGVLFICRHYLNFQLEVSTVRGVCGAVNCLQAVRGTS